MWFNPWTLGAFLGVFVIYPYAIWKRGSYQVAAYWLDLPDFSGPSEHYGSLLKKRSLPQNIGLCLLGHIIGLFHCFVVGGLFLGFLLIVPFLLFGWNG